MPRQAAPCCTAVRRALVHHLSHAPHHGEPARLPSPTRARGCAHVCIPRNPRTLCAPRTFAPVDPRTNAHSG
eukprot:3039915-Lingulodinium_polyedra.AAC.1